MNKSNQPIKGRPFRRGPARSGPRPGGRAGGPRQYQDNRPRPVKSEPAPVPKISQKEAATVKMPEGMVYYCKSCQQIVDYKPETFAFKSKIENCLKEKSGAGPEKMAEMQCDIAFGTERSIKHFYKIRDEKFDKERREKEEKAMRADKL